MEETDNQGLEPAMEGSPPLGFIKRIQKRLQRNPDQNSNQNPDHNPDQTSDWNPDVLPIASAQSPVASITLSVPPADARTEAAIEPSFFSANSVEPPPIDYLTDSSIDHPPVEDHSLIEPMRNFRTNENSKSPIGFPANSVSESMSNSMSNSMLLNESPVSIQRDSALGWLLTAVQQLRQAKTVEALLNITVAEVRQHFQSDRVLIFQFQSESHGTVLAESLANGYTPSLREPLPAIAFGAEQSSHYWQLPFISVEDVTKRSLTPHQRQLFERFQVMASLSVPIFMGPKLWGLLVVQQCTRPNYWQEAQILLLHQVVAHLQNALQPLEFSEERQLFDRISSKLQQMTSLDNLFQTVTRDIAKYLSAERVIVLQFQPGDSGTILCEATVGNLPALAGTVWQEMGDRFGSGLPLVTNTADADELSRVPTALSESVELQSCAIVPILQGETLWGALGVLQHSNRRQWQDEEVKFLTQISQLLGVALQQTALAETQRKAETYRQELPSLIGKIGIHASVQEACQVAVQEVQKLLQVERVAIYKFRSNYFGDFVYESEPGDFPVLVGSAWEDTFLKEHQGGRFQQNEAFVVDDIYQAGLSHCHISTLKHFGVRSVAVVGIKQGNKLWGLLSAFQHSDVRHWLDSEVTLLSEIGARLGMTMQEADYLVQLQEQATHLSKAAQLNQAVTAIIPRLLQATTSATLFQVTTQSVRRLLKCDRVTLHRLREDGSQEWMTESIAQGLTSLQTAQFENRFSPDRLALQNKLHSQGKNWVVNNIHTAGYTTDETEYLEELGIQAFIRTPIFQQGVLWGVLSVYQNEPRSWAEIELLTLQQIGVQVDAAMQQLEHKNQVQQLTEQLTQTVQREQLVLKIVERVRQSLDLQQTFRTTAREIRNFLEVDRVAIFKLDAESGYREGETIAEDVQPGYVSALAVKVVDHCFSENFAEMYRQGRVWATADIYQAGLQSCYIDVLSKFQVRANLVVPLLRGDELWGLFCVHHCQDAREWHSTDIEFVKQIAAQLNIAIQQGEYVEQLQRQSEELLETAEQSKTVKETLQREVIQLLSAVRPALNGDLTVRAPVTDTTVGTIADAYNNTLSSLQQIVMQMQTASTQVAQTSQSSEASLSSLSVQAGMQLQSLNQALEQVQRLAHSTQVVETYVQQVESTVQQANETVMSGDEAIDRTVDEMDKIREIVAETNLRLQRLSESSQKISRIVSVIGNFTTQTQLLALNAAIEATRAGEYGRGFAVVADEVRSLARQSADAAVEIEQLVQDIQASTAEVATAMESGSQQVASGTRVVNEARENLNSIVNATSQISELVTHITQVMQEQTQQCQTMTETMNNVAAIANKTSEDSVTISTSFKDLLNMAQDLQAKSKRFKVA